MTEEVTTGALLLILNGVAFLGKLKMDNVGSLMEAKRLLLKTSITSLLIQHRLLGKPLE